MSHYQPGMPQSYSNSLVNGMAHHRPVMKQGTSGAGIALPQETVVMGRGVGRGRGRSILTPARQPNTQPPPMVSPGMGRGIGSLTSRTSLLFSILALLEIRGWSLQPLIQQWDSVLYLEFNVSKWMVILIDNNKPFSCYSFLQTISWEEVLNW